MPGASRIQERASDPVGLRRERQILWDSGEGVRSRGTGIMDPHSARTARALTTEPSLQPKNNFLPNANWLSVPAKIRMALFLMEMLWASSSFSSFVVLYN